MIIALAFLFRVWSLPPYCFLRQETFLHIFRLALHPGVQMGTGDQNTGGGGGILGLTSTLSKEEKQYSQSFHGKLRNWKEGPLGHFARKMNLSFYPDGYVIILPFFWSLIPFYIFTQFEYFPIKIEYQC